MKLILTSTVDKLGIAGDIVEVRNGYGRNYLVPQGKAIVWSRGAEKQIEGIKRARDAREVRGVEHAQELRTQIEELTIKVPAHPYPDRAECRGSGAGHFRGACRHPCKALQNHMRANYKGGVLHVSGKVPESCLGNEMYVNMLNMREFVQKSFINQWRYSGGEITDGIRAASVPPHAKTLAVHQSKPMSAILTDMNKYSNNLIARSVFLKLGGEHSGNSALQQASSVVWID